jgi:hypothetical protein
MSQLLALIHNSSLKSLLRCLFVPRISNFHFPFYLLTYFFSNIFPLYFPFFNYFPPDTFAARLLPVYFSISRFLLVRRNSRMRSGPAWTSRRTSSTGGLAPAL